MMTKEDILDDCHWKFVNEKGVSSISTKKFPAAYSEQAQIAMDEYAKEQSIAFNKWTVDNKIELVWDVSYNQVYKDSSNTQFEPEEVYAKFLEFQSTNH